MQIMRNVGIFVSTEIIMNRRPRQHSTMMMISTADAALEFNDSTGENSSRIVIYWSDKKKNYANNDVY